MEFDWKPQSEYVFICFMQFLSKGEDEPHFLFFFNSFSNTIVKLLYVSFSFLSLSLSLISLSSCNNVFNNFFSVLLFVCFNDCIKLSLIKILCFFSFSSFVLFTIVSFLYLLSLIILFNLSISSIKIFIYLNNIINEFACNF